MEGRRGILLWLGLLALGAGLLLWSLAPERTDPAAATETRPAGESRVLPEASPELDVPGSVEPAGSAAPGREERADVGADAGGVPGGVPAGATAFLGLELVARESGAPLAGVRVCARPRQGTSSIRNVAGALAAPGEAPVTDASGRARLAVRAGVELRLEVNRDGEIHARPETRTLPALAAREERRLRIELDTAEELRWFARVLDDDTGAPLEGVAVEWLHGRPALGSPGDRPVASAADGGLALGFAPESERRIRLVLAGRFAPVLNLERGYETPETARVVRMLRAAALRVVVEDADGGGLAGQALRLRGRPEAAVQDWVRLRDAGYERRGRTDERGECLFSELPPNLALEVELIGSGRGRRVSRLVLAPGETRTLTIDAAGACTIEGLVRDPHGTPLEALEVWCLPASRGDGFFHSFQEEELVSRARTDAAGRYRLEGVPPGEWWIGPDPGDERAAGARGPAARLTVESQDRRLALDLTCFPGLRIRGRVLDADGRPASAFVTGAQGERDVTASTDRDGGFELGPLAAGEWILSTKTMAGSSAAGEPVPAQAGDTEVVLRLSTGAELLGRVVDERGAPVPRVFVTLSPGPSPGDFAVMTWSGADGEFRFGGLTPGVWAISASSGALAALASPIEVARGEKREGLELVLTRSAELCLRLPAGSEAGLERRLSRDGVAFSRDVLPAGEDACTRVLPGPIRVEVLRWTRAAGFEVLESRDVVLAPGESTRLVLDPDPVR